jgi:tRNA-Thr(GGU) m(6)t(6)A37 methyltransferase TsaA
MEEQSFLIRSIGIIHSPYKSLSDIPIQGNLNKENEAYAELNEKYKKGLLHLDGFSHAILIYHFHKSKREDIIGRPYLENKEHGIFAIRSPHRPNHLGLSIVEIERIVNNKLYFTCVDMLDGTPLIDIKPYVKYFDQPENVICGWLEKHWTD